MKDDLKGYSKEDRYNLFLNHIIGQNAPFFEQFASKKTLGDMLVLVAYLNAALVSQITLAEVRELAAMTADFGRIYPELVERAGGATQPGQVVMVVPMLMDMDYTIPARIEDYLTPEELRGDNFSDKATPNEEAKINSIMSTDISKTIQ